MSWAMFYRPGAPEVLAMTPFYNEQRLGGYICTVAYVSVENVAAPTNPICPDGGGGDPLSATGCSDFNNPLPQQLGGCPNCKNGLGDMVGNPINVANGNKFETVTDYESAGPDKLAFTRYYNSQSGQLSSLGYGWKSNFERLIFSRFGGPPSSSNYNMIWRADGAVYYLFKGDIGWLGDADISGTIATDGATVWTYTDGDDTVETYGFVSGKLLSIRTRSGYQQNLQYDAAGNLAAVTDSHGRTLSFTYANGVLQTLTDPDGRVYAYSYSTGTTSAADRLVRVTYPGTAPNPTVQYLYEDARFPYALTGIVDENGNRFASWTYDSARRAISSQHAGGADAVTLSYAPDGGGGGLVTITNALGKQTIDHIGWTAVGMKFYGTDEQPGPNTPAASTRVWYDYDGRGYVSRRQDKNGNVTVYQNAPYSQTEPRMRLQSKTEAYGTAQARTTSYTWHPVFELPTQIVEPGRTTTFAYDANGFLLTKTQTDTTTATAPYGTNGRTRRWSYTYTPAGLLASVTGPRSDVAQVTSYAWDAAGALVSVTNALGQVTQVTQHDASGRPQTMVDANGVATTIAYDARGRVTTMSVAGATTTIAYDPAGNVVQVTRPDGSFLAYTYDAAHRLIRVADAFDERIDYTLDALGNRTQTQIHGPGGAVLAKTQSQIFDELGRLLRSIGAAGQTTSYAYDKDDNTVAVTDPLSNATGQSFDALDRLIQVAAPLASTTAYGYDSHDNRTSVTDPRGLVTSYVYDGLDNLIQVTSPDTGTTVYVVDDAGNRVQQTDAAGVVVQMSYDALDRLTAKTYPADPAENVTYRYDEAAAGFGIGRLTSVSDASGSTAYVYDARGNVVQETRVIGGQSYITSYAYDLADHVVQVTYPSGRIVGYTRDAMGRISDVATQANAAAVPVAVASGATYAPFGPLTALAYGNGLGLSIQYDQDYQPTGRLVTGSATVQDLSYGVDAAGNITGISDHLAAPRSQVFQYDALSRLTYAGGLYGALSYGYDAVGNRRSQTGGTTNLAESYTYAANSNRLLSVVNGGVTRSLSYTPTGNLASDDRGGGAALSFAYDQSNRMVQVANQNQALATYAYNFLGQRAAKTTPSTITQFVYDHAGHVLAESDGATGAAQTEYLWLGDMPLALVTNGNLYFVHTDHLGTPQKATDASQNVAWDAVLRPFGQAEQQTFPSLTNLRFPGQYFDAEDGLHQNGFRDYDPSLGRYIESDPIGLRGGINTYRYANANPLLYKDPLGLASWKDLGGWFRKWSRCPPDDGPEDKCKKRQDELNALRGLLLAWQPMIILGDPKYAEVARDWNAQAVFFNREAQIHNWICKGYPVEPLPLVPLGPQGPVP